MQQLDRNISEGHIVLTKL